MARFDWQGAIVKLATEVEGCAMAQRMFADLPDACARMEQTRDKQCRYAAWLARSYCRRGRKQRGRARRAA